MMNQCPECGSKNLQHNPELGEIICNDCGFVVADAIPRQEEEFEGQVQHTARPTTSSAGTGVIPTLKGRKVKKGWVVSHREGIVHRAWQCIDGVASHLKIPESIIKESIRIFKIVHSKDLCVGRVMKPIALACLYVACKTYEYPRKIEDVAEWGMADKKDIMNAYKMIKKNIDVNIPLVDLQEYVMKTASDMGFRSGRMGYIIDIYNRIKKKGLTSGKNPKSLAAVVLFITSKVYNMGLTQRQIAQTTGVIELTVRKRVKEIVEKLDDKEITVAVGGS